MLDGDLIIKARNAAEQIFDSDLNMLSLKNKIIYENLMEQYGKRLQGLTPAK